MGRSPRRSHGMVGGVHGGAQGMVGGVQGIAAQGISPDEALNLILTLLVMAVVEGVREIGVHAMVGGVQGMAARGIAADEALLMKVFLPLVVVGLVIPRQVF